MLKVKTTEEATRLALDLVEQTALSAYRADWAIRTPGTPEIEAYVRKDSRKDESLFPNRVLLQAVQEAGMEGRVCRRGANNYMLVLEKHDDAQLQKAAQLLDLCGLTTKRDGRVIRSAEAQQQERATFQERMRESFGVVGLDRVFGEAEVYSVCAQATWT